MTQPVPLPLTYADGLCVLDVDPLGAETTSDLQNLIQDVFHLLITWPGTNPDDPTLGIGVDLYLSGTTKDLDALQKKIPQQLLEDDRIPTCTASVTQEADGSFTLDVEIGVGSSTLGLQYSYTQEGGLLQTGVQWP